MRKGFLICAIALVGVAIACSHMPNVKRAPNQEIREVIYPYSMWKVDPYGCPFNPYGPYDPYGDTNPYAYNCRNGMAPNEPYYPYTPFVPKEGRIEKGTGHLSSTHPLYKSSTKR